MIQTEPTSNHMGPDSPLTTDAQPSASMVERVAAAIWPHAEWNGDYQEAVAAARAAIAAMREPTEGMSLAGDKRRYSGATNYDAADVYHAMIDAALGEQGCMPIRFSPMTTTFRSA